MKVTIGSCVRNQEGVLANFIRDATRLAQRFEDASIFVYENDSSDETRNMLIEWSRGDARVQLAMLRARPRSIRTERLAECRKLIWSHAQDSDVLVVVDSDYTGSIDVDSVVRVATTLNETTAVFATSSEYIYDVWALRHARYEYTDPFRDGLFVHLLRMPLRVQTGEREPVRSAFNGLGVYNVRQISRVDHRCSYQGRYDDGHPICEHVPFHLCLLERVPNATMLIDGNLVTPTRRTSLFTSIGLHYSILVVLLLAALCRCFFSCHRSTDRRGRFKLLGQTDAMIDQR